MTRRSAAATPPSLPLARRTLLALLPLTLLAACGRKSEPKPPPSETPRPRRTYPPEE